jgi:N-acetylmuramoyl-L-alanine amidase
LTTASSQRRPRWGALLLLAALPAMPAYARAHHGESWAREHFATAERMREALNGRPPAERTRRDYQRVINAYRNVYYGAPTSTKADPSVVAVAETLVEMGRRFGDDKVLNSAIGEYKFLRREYPGSKYRCDALFTIGEIYKDDLDDPEQARATFQEFLHRYPHNRLVEDAQQAIRELDRPAQAETTTGKETDNDGTNQKTAKDSVPKSTDAHPDASARNAAEHDAARPASRLPRVTGIRHWSTPDYTRVAIDIESEVKFGSSRLPDPDRIFFDLHDTKLASTLVGKSFDVDDGFLKKIRVAQFQPGRTRVVLEVESLSDYDAFLLPNPYRLIVDIHGKGGSNIARARAAKEALGLSAPEAMSKESKESKELSQPDASPVSTRAEATKGESKALDLRARAGKAPVISEDVSDEAKLTPNHDTSDSLPRSSRATHTLAPAKGAPAVTKVVVEADDDDIPPVKAAAKLELPAGHDVLASAAKTNRDGAGKPALFADDALSDKPVRDRTDRVGTTKPKSSSRLHKKETEAADADIREASPTARGDRSLIRALGLKIGKIVIDPGHGGHDTGTIGPDGLAEKDLVLEVGRRLGKLLETRLGAEVVYTRKNDTFIPLETRTAIANQQRADLFISIHANSSEDPAARGVETYYLNFTSSPDALEVAARENEVSEKSIYELQDLVKKIALKEKIEESREFAGDVQESLHSGLAARSPGIRNRGVKKAPFIVLIGANMPSILAEISFVSNPTDERRLETSEYRQRIAESLYRGIAKYVNGLSGVKVASKLDRTTGQ